MSKEFKCCKCSNYFLRIGKEMWCPDCYMIYYGQSYEDLMKDRSTFARVPAITKIEPESKKVKPKSKKVKRNLFFEIEPKSKKAKNNLFFEYKELVGFLTEEVKCFLPGIDRRGVYSFHIDHKISIKFGFDNNIPVEVISHPSNLWLIWHKDNMGKGSRIFVDKDNAWILSKYNIDPLNISNSVVVDYNNW